MAFTASYWKKKKTEVQQSTIERWYRFAHTPWQAAPSLIQYLWDFFWLFIKETEERR